MKDGVFEYWIWHLKCAYNLFPIHNFYILVKKFHSEIALHCIVIILKLELQHSNILTDIFKFCPISARSALKEKTRDKLIIAITNFTRKKNNILFLAINLGQSFLSVLSYLPLVLPSYNGKIQSNIFENFQWWIRALLARERLGVIQEILDNWDLKKEI